jgi:hypothetical protein
VFLGLWSLAAAAAADPLVIGRWSVDGGGTGYAQNGPIIMGGTVGQPDAGRITRLNYTLVGGFWVPGAPMPVGVGEDPGPGGDPGTGTPPLPLHLQFHRVAPNPFVGRTVVAFDLPEARDAEVRVFDIGGALVRTLWSGMLGAGRHRFEWNASGDDGRRVAPGLYLVRTRVGDVERSQKLVVLR